MRAPGSAGFMTGLLALALLGCATAGNSGQTPTVGTVVTEDDWILGQWRIATQDGSSPTLVIVMDSVANRTVHGHVLRYMAGNSGRGPRDFRPFSGHYSVDESITVTAEWTDSASPPIDLIFQRVRDTMEIREFQLGGEDMTAGGRIWVVTRIER